jgi:hypothetical protein
MSVIRASERRRSIDPFSVRQFPCVFDVTPSGQIGPRPIALDLDQFYRLIALDLNSAKKEI